MVQVNSIFSLLSHYGWLWFIVVTKLGVTTPSAPQKQSNRARDHITNFPWKSRWRLKQKMLKKFLFI